MIDNLEHNLEELINQIIIEEVFVQLDKIFENVYFPKDGFFFVLIWGYGYRLSCNSMFDETLRQEVH